METQTVMYDVPHSKKEENSLSELDSLKEEEQELLIDRNQCLLFSVVTWGSSWTERLVFTVMAENEVWAEEMVRQWLISNGREDHKIDKVMALVSRDVRAIVNVGAKLLDV